MERLGPVDSGVDRCAVSRIDPSEGWNPADALQSVPDDISRQVGTTGVLVQQAAARALPEWPRARRSSASPLKWVSCATSCVALPTCAAVPGWVSGTRRPAVLRMSP